MNLGKFYVSQVFCSFVNFSGPRTISALLPKGQLRAICITMITNQQKPLNRNEIQSKCRCKKGCLIILCIVSNKDVYYQVLLMAQQYTYVSLLTSPIIAWTENGGRCCFSMNKLCTDFFFLKENSLVWSHCITFVVSAVHSLTNHFHLNPFESLKETTDVRGEKQMVRETAQYQEHYSRRKCIPLFGVLEKRE